MLHVSFKFVLFAQSFNRSDGCSLKDVLKVIKTLWFVFSVSERAVVVLYPGEIGTDVQPGQRLADAVAQLGRGGVRVFVVTAGVVEGAVDPAADLAQVEVEFGHAFL